MSVIAQLRKQYPNLQSMTDDQIIDYTAQSNGVKQGSPQYDQLRQYMGGYDRSMGDVAKDTVLGLGQGLVTVGKGVAELGGLVLPGVNAYDNPVTRGLDKASQFLGQYESPGLRNQQAAADISHQIAERNAANAGEGGVGQWLAGAGATLGSYIEHPGLVGQFVAENAAQFVPIGLAGRGAKIGADLIGLGERAAGIGTGAAVATGAGLQGTQAADQTYQELVQRGVDPKQAASMATAAGVKSAAVSGGLAMLPFGRAIEQRLAGNEVSGYGLRGVGRTLAATGVESATEGADEGYGQYAQNQEVRQMDPTVSPWRGVGQASVQGALVSAPFGVWAGATGGHGNARTPTGDIDLTRPGGAVADEMGPQDPRRFVGPQYNPASFVDLVNPQKAVQTTPASFVDMANGQYSNAPTDPLAVMAGQPITSQPPAPQPAPATFADLVGQQAAPVQTTPASYVDMAQGQYSDQPTDQLAVMAGQPIATPTAPAAPVQTSAKPTVGAMLSALNAANKEVKGRLVRKDGQLANTREAAPVKEIINSPDPLAAMQEMYQGGGAPKDQLLDLWHQALTGRTIDEARAEQQPAPQEQAEPAPEGATLPTNEAGFVPEPQAQLAAQVDAVRQGRKPAVVMAVGEAKKQNLDGLTQAIATDPKTRKRAVVVAADPAVVDSTVKRVKEVGLKQAMGEALGYANPKLTSEPSPNAAVVQQVDNANGQVIDEQAATPQDVPNIRQVPGTTPRVVPVEQAVAERAAGTQAESAVPVNTANSEAPVKPKKFKFGRKSTDQLIDIADTTKDDGEYEAARYEMYKRWENDADDGASEAYLTDTKNRSALTDEERATFQQRLDGERAAQEAKRGQKLGRKFDATVNEPTTPLARVSDTGNAENPYEHLQLRPGTTQAQLDAGRAAFDALEHQVKASDDADATRPFTGVEKDDAGSGAANHGRRPGDNTSLSERALGVRATSQGARLLGHRLLDGYRHSGRNRLVGQVVNNAADVAVLAQVYRNPRFETLRVFFVDAAGHIVGENAYSSRLPGTVVPPERFLPELLRDIGRFKAKGYYLLHNHPAGAAAPSDADVRSTRILAEAAPGLLQHIVIDHNEFAVIQPNGNYRLTAAPELDGIDFAAQPSIAHPILGRRVASVDDLVETAKQLQTRSGFATLVGADSRGRVNLIADIPMAMVMDGTPKGRIAFAALVRRATHETGAGAIRFLVLPDASVSGPSVQSMRRGVLTDVLTSSGVSALESGITPATENVFSQRAAARVTGNPVPPVNDNTVQIQEREASAHPYIAPFTGAAKDVVAYTKAQATGKEVSSAILSSLSLRQIDEQYGKKLPALRRWIGAFQKRDAAAHHLAAAADNVALEWEQKLSAKDKKALADVLLGASINELALDNTDPKYVSGLNEPELAQYHMLRAKLAALSPDAQAIRHKVLDILRQQHKATIDAIQKLITETVPDPEQRAKRLTEFKEAMGKNRGDYFPLSRFGDRVVIGRGAAADGRDVVSFHESTASAEAEVRRLKAAGVKKIDLTLRPEYDPKNRPTAGFVGKLHEMVDTNDIDPEAKESLHEAIQQLYLRAMPELSGAKQYIRRQNVEGFSRDAMRVFADSVTRGGRYAAHLAYAPEVQAAQEAAESQTKTGSSRPVAVVVGHKDGAEPVVRIVEPGTARLDAANEMADDGYAPTFFTTVPEGVADRLRTLLPDATSDTLDGYTKQAEKLAGRDVLGVEDKRAAQALYNHMISLQRVTPHGTLDTVVDTLGQVGYTWYLGFSPAFWLMNTLQNPMIGMPVLGAKYGMAKSWGHWVQAMKWFGGVRMGKLLRDGKTPFSVQWLRDEVAAGRLAGISKNELNMLQELEDRQVLDFTRAMDLARIGNASSKGWHKFIRFAAAGAHHTEVFNRVTFALAAYRLALQSGENVTHAQAVDRAESDVASAHFDYSPGNKPAMMRGRAARAVLQFQQYRQHMLYWWGKTVKDMVKGESPEVRRQAVKAALLMGATQGMFAGALGLPFVGTIGLLAGALVGGDDDEPFDFEKWIQQAAIEATGSKKAGEVMAKGIFAAFGADVSNRIGQANLMPLLNKQGSWQYADTTEDKWRDYLFDLLGPLGSIALGIAKSEDKFANGDTMGGLQGVTPKSVADLLRAYQISTQGLRNSRGQQLATAEAFDGADRFMQAAGVTPISKTEINADRGAVLDADQFYKDRSSRLTRAFVESWMRQDRAGMTDAVGDIEQYNKKLMGKGLADKSFIITGQKLESAIRDWQRKSMMLALTGGTAQDKRQLMLATRLTGLYDPITLATMQERMNNLPGLPGLPR